MLTAKVPLIWVQGVYPTPTPPLLFLSPHPHPLTYIRQQTVFPSVFFSEAFCWFVIFIILCPKLHLSFYLIFDTFLLVCYKLLFITSIHFLVCLSFCWHVYMHHHVCACCQWRSEEGLGDWVRDAVNYNMGALHCWAISPPHATGS